MRVLLIFLSLTLISCTSVKNDKTKEGEPDIELFRTSEGVGTVSYNTFLHVRIGTAIKNFYCLNDRFPESTFELIEYGLTKSSIREKDWLSLTQNGVELVVKDSLRLTTPKTKNNPEITSVHAVPDCVKNITRVSFDN